MASPDQDRQTESRRILDRVMREADSSAPSMIARNARQARDHVSAKDAEATDLIEYWGTRIGRALGLVVCAVLLVWLAFFALQAM